MVLEYKFVGGAFKLNAIPLTEEEKSRLEAQLDNLFGFDDATIKDAIMKYHDQIVAFVEVMKNELSNPTFGGVTAADTQLGISLIAPQHIQLNGTKRTDWSVSYNADWVTFANGSTDEDEGLLIIGLLSYSADPKLDAVKMQIGQQSFLPQVVSPIKVKDNRNQVAIWPLPAIPITPRQTYTIELHSDEWDANNPPTDEIALLGVTVARGRYLNSAI